MSRIQAEHGDRLRIHPGWYGGHRVFVNVGTDRPPIGFTNSALELTRRNALRAAWALIRAATAIR